MMPYLGRCKTRRMMIKAVSYYDLNVQVWEDEDGHVYYSVIQEFDEEGKDTEVLAYGETESVSEAAALAKRAVLDVLDP